MALIDIMGKLAKAPAHQVLGGPTRNKARALASLYGSNQTQLVESLKQRLDTGLRSVSVPLILPPGPTKGHRFYRDVRRVNSRCLCIFFSFRAYWSAIWAIHRNSRRFYYLPDTVRDDTLPAGVPLKHCGSRTKRSTEHLRVYLRVWTITQTQASRKRRPGGRRG